MDGIVGCCPPTLASTTNILRGDLDALSVSSGGKLAWYENMLGGTQVKNTEIKVRTCRLGNCYPNPFNNMTRITFTIDKTAKVTLAVYDILGRPVATLLDRGMEIGTHSVVFNAGDLPSGVYLYRLHTDEFNDVKKMVLSR